MSDILNTVPLVAQITLIVIGFLCGAGTAWAFLLGYIVQWKSRALVAERLLELEKKYHEEDRVEWKKHLAFEQGLSQRVRQIDEELDDEQINHLTKSLTTL